MEQTETRKRDLPLWPGLTLILLGLLVGGWFIYWQLSGYLDGKPKMLTIPGADPGQYTNMQPQPGQRGPGNPQRFSGNRVTAPVDEIRSFGTDSWQVKAGGMMLNIKMQGGTPTFEGYLLNPSTFHNDYSMTLLARTRLKPEQLTALGLTGEQLRLMKQVQGSALVYPAQLQPADTATLTPLFAQWQAAADSAKRAKASAVVAAGRKIAAQRLAVAKTRAAAQVDAFRKTFSDAEWQKLRDAALPKTATP